MEQQKKISVYLKIITCVMMAAVVAFVVVLTATAYGLKSRGETSLWQFVIFTYIYGGCGIAILIDFFNVCTRIGNGDSFSVGNANSFRLMERTAYIATLASLGRIIWCFIANKDDAYAQAISLINMSPMTKMLYISLAEFLTFLVLGLMCRALSALILNAAEIKQENELTI